jgi:AhpD family alkylhydroperoxidase
MTTEQRNLNAEQKELVAVGASVGAGCKPCVSHHLKAGAQAGLGGEQLLAAVASAERIGAEAAVAMGDHAREKLGASVSSPALLSRLEEALASLGAALGVNDATNIERQLRAAAHLGASRSQLQQAIDTAHTVQENAARIHLREAERLLDEVATTVTTTTGDHHGDGCGADAEAEEAPVTAGEPVAATSGHAAGCGGIATQSATSDDFAAMAGCREMFERFMSAVSSTETDKAPAATSATGACNKEA